MRRRSLIIALAILWAGSPTARAGVVASAEEGFTVRTGLEIAAPADRIFTALTDGIAQWWNPDHTFGGDASRLSLQPVAGGGFDEALPDGGSVRHLEVLYVQPGHLLRLGGGLGPLQGMAVTGVLTIELVSLGEDTSLEMDYSVSGWAPQGLAGLAEPVDRVLAGQMTRLKAYVER